MKKAVSSKPTRRAGRFARGAAALCTALGLGVTAGADAQNICNETTCPPTFTIAEKPLQKVTTTFKFQSRISQAKIPVGDARLAKVIVNVKRGSDAPLCTETLTDVMVRDSVLNIEIGRSMSCQLDEVIANNNDLSFQVCIGGSENCLKPVSLGTVPQAIKASFAAQAQEAYKAQIAAQAHYAHRITPDADMTVTNGTVTRGYYDFQTPNASTVMLDTLVTNGQTYPGGYIQWTPVTEQAADNVLHISGAAKNGTTRTLKDLAEFYVHAGTTRVMGALNVRTGATVQSGGVTVQAGGVNVQAGGVTVQNGGLVVQSGETRTLAPARTLAGLEVQNTLTVTTGGAVVSDGGLTVTGLARFNTGTTVAGGLAVTSGSTFLNGGATVAGGLTVSSGTASLQAGAAVANGLTVTSGALTVESTASFGGGADVTAGGVRVSGDSVFKDVVTFEKAPVFVGGTPVTGNSVNSGAVIDGSIRTIDVAGCSADAATSFCVSTEMIADGSVTSADIRTGAVGTASLADGAVSAVKLADSAVTSAKIRGSSIGSREISLTRFPYTDSGYLDEVAVSDPATGTGTVVELLNFPSGGGDAMNRGLCFVTGALLKSATGGCRVLTRMTGFTAIGLNARADKADCTFVCF